MVNDCSACRVAKGGFTKKLPNFRVENDLIYHSASPEVKILCWPGSLSAIEGKEGEYQGEDQTPLSIPFQMITLAQRMDLRWFM
jgi:hypothetical protein